MRLKSTDRIPPWQMSPAKNAHKVPRKQWSKWSEAQRHLFNEMYEGLAGMRSIPLAPGLDKLTVRGCNVLRWNVAWIAADKLGQIHPRVPR